MVERGADTNNTEHKFSLIESGVFKNKYANDFTFEFSTGTDKTVPKSLETTILVLNAFNRGSLGINNRNDKQRFRVADNLLFDTKKHSLKLGGEILYEKFKSVSENNNNGTFTFLNLADFTNGKPSQFSQTLGEIKYQLGELQTAFYFQDYFKPSKVLQMSLGLRYEWQSRLSDYNNFSP